MSASAQGCVFCTIPQERIVAGNTLAFAVRDAYPVSPGHTLVIPRRHVSSFFEASGAEHKALLGLLDTVKTMLDAELSPAGYNIGINDGPAAGQTVHHLHVHLMPRFLGDCSDPRGGVRWIVPDKADYWTPRG